MAARAVAGALVVVGLWWLATALFEPPAYIFPRPDEVLDAFLRQPWVLAGHALVTLSEIVIGLGVGAAAGVASALSIAATPSLRRIVLPVVIVTQTLPVFAIAPLLVIWLGYGLSSKIAMAALIIYFPVATAYAEAMSRIDHGLVELSRLNGATPLQTLWIIRRPAGLPGLAAGLKVAATVAPIGAVVGEWVGASHGLGYLMLHANARLQTDTLFAALALLAAIALALRAVVDALAARLAPWARDV